MWLTARWCDRWLCGQESAVTALLCLASHEGSRNTVIRRLVAVLDERNTAAQLKAAEALAALSSKSAGNRSAIVQAGAIERLVVLLGDGRRADAGTPPERAAAALADLSRIAESRGAIGRAGGVGPLVTMLCSTSQDAQTHAATTLFHLSTTVDNKVRLRATACTATPAPPRHPLVCSARLSTHLLERGRMPVPPSPSHSTPHCAHTAPIRRPHGAHTAPIRRPHGAHTAPIRARPNGLSGGHYDDGWYSEARRIARHRKPRGAALRRRGALAAGDLRRDQERDRRGCRHPCVCLATGALGADRRGKGVRSGSALGTRACPGEGRALVGLGGRERDGCARAAAAVGCLGWTCPANVPIAAGATSSAHQASTPTNRILTC